MSGLDNFLEKMQTAKDFLQRYPWSEQWLPLGKPLDYLWRFHLEVTLEDLWPHLSDTSTLNHRLGLPGMRFTETNGKLFGYSVNAGIRMQWEEVPWEWEYGRSIKAARIYSKGLAHYVRIYYLLETPADNTVQLVVYFGWIPRHWWGRWLLKIGMKRIEQKYAAVLQEISAEIREKVVEGSLPLPATHPVDHAKLKSLHSLLLEKKLPLDVVEALIHYIKTAPDQELYRIRPGQLAQSLGKDRLLLLKAMLYATRAGYLSLTWDMICPHCRGVRRELTHLWEIPQSGSCDFCNIDFETSGLNALEVTFHVHPEIRQVEQVYFCSAEPTKKPHIKLQMTLEPNKRYHTRLYFFTGTYRLRILGQKSFNILHIDPGSDQAEIQWQDSLINQTIYSAAQPGILLFNTSSRQLTFIIEEHEIDRFALRPYELFNFQEFRDLFPQEAIAYDVQLDIGVQNIVFIDIIGSTRLYRNEGDSRAFARVRQYFRKTHDIAVRYGGAIVKTIGDAVMLSFDSPLNALNSAVELAKYFCGSHPETPIQARISLNRGPCLAVRLNSNIDYFGQTVNLAAKLQKYADSGKIVLSESIRKEPRAEAFLNESHDQLQAIPQASIKGYGQINAWHLKI